MKPSREIRDLVLGYLHDVASGDPRVIDTISTSDAAVGIGTDAAEYVEGGRQVRALMATQVAEIHAAYTAAGRRLDPVDLKIQAYEVGDFGWAASSCIMHTPDGTPFLCRGSFVCHREDNSWKFLHFHASVPFGNESMGLKLTTDIEEVAELVELERPELRSVTSPEGTVTIAFTDLESSTATNESMGDDAFLPLLLRHNEIVRSRTAESGGSVVKSQGDGFMLAFPSARRAVDCASAVQRDVAAVDDRLKVRMGLHTGEPVRDADDFFGRDVAYAARIGSAASGGEILVSALVKSLVEPSGSVTFEQPRELDLKGFDGPQAVYPVRWSADA